MSSFYVGYLPRPPADLARFIRRVVVALIVLAAVIGGALVLAQRGFEPSVFEFGSINDFEGVIETTPYPALLVRRPGSVPANEQYSRYLLVGVGKHGADPDVLGFKGRYVRLKGKLVYRPGQTMVEVMPDSVQATGTANVPSPQYEAGPIVSIRGEIVDSKCNAGVMNPGSGKVHRDCAVRCLSGGIPPILLAQENGTRVVYWLADTNGESLKSDTFLNKVAEPVVVTGQVSSRGDTRILRVRGIRRQ